MKFQGQLITNDIPIFLGDITFTKTHILTRKVEQYRPHRTAGANVPTNENYAMPHGTPYTAEFLGDTKNIVGRYDDIRITYKDFGGQECTGYVLTDSDNHCKAKWIHKQNWLSQNFTTIIFTIFTAVLTSLLTYILTTPSC